MNNIDFEKLRENLSIIDLAIIKGYKLLPSEGLKHPVLKHFDLNDKIIISNSKNAANQGYWSAYNDNDKGHIYHFIKNRLNLLFRTDSSSLITEHQRILEIMLKYSNVSYQTYPDLHSHISKSKKLIQSYKQSKFILPILDNITNNTHFLESRGISKSTIFTSIFSDRILSRKYPYFNNTVFPYFDKDENVIGLEERNTNFKKFQAGSDKENGIWMSVIPSKIANIYFFESPIDAISYVQLKLAIKPDSLLISTAGTIADGQLNTLQSLLSSKNKASSHTVSLICCTDNDEAGEKLFEKIKSFFCDKNYSLIRELPISKDFNEDLKNHKKNFLTN